MLSGFKTHCGGYLIDLKDLLEKPAPDTNLFGSLLEYLLFKGAIFNLCPVNLYKKKGPVSITSTICQGTSNIKGGAKSAILFVIKKKKVQILDAGYRSNLLLGFLNMAFHNNIGHYMTNLFVMVVAII